MKSPFYKVTPMPPLFVKEGLGEIWEILHQIQDAFLYKRNFGMDLSLSCIFLLQRNNSLFSKNKRQIII